MDHNKIQVRNIALVPGQPIVVTLGQQHPLQEGPLATHGPGVAHLAVGDEAFNLQPLTVTGRPVGPPLNATCPTPHPLVPIFPAVVR